MPPAPDLTDEQVKQISAYFTGQAKEVVEITQMLNEYIAAGGRDRETYDRLMQGMARAGMSMAMHARSVLDPGEPQKAIEAVEAADDREGMRAHLQRQAAVGLLGGVWAAGGHHLVEREEWPPGVVEAVMGAVRSASRINDDPMMANLQD